MSVIIRQRTAIRRRDLSRPLRVCIEDGLLTQDKTVFDYGCGRGDDVRRLREAGYNATGWDPLHVSTSLRSPADVVNIGYVINVIEDLSERDAALVDAWSLSKDILVVSARLTFEDEGQERRFGDGVITSRQTFQKFFSQNELGAYILGLLGQDPIARAPGVFYVFRDANRKESFLASQSRRSSTVPRLRQTERQYAENRDILDQLASFVAERGRLPTDRDQFDSSALEIAIGGVKPAFRILKRVFGSEDWAASSERVRQDLLVYLALAKFRGRAKFSGLEPTLQEDIKSLCGSYSGACDSADELLFSIGRREMLEECLANSPVGKLTPGGLYVHRTALITLTPALRVYEGCARSLVGTMDGANIIKLHRRRFAISYLHYPRFDDDAHPSLSGSLIVDLSSREIRFRDYSTSDNPPILHRKETFVLASHPLRQKYEKLTSQEEAHHLYEDVSRIGLREAWLTLLASKGLRIRGHQLQRVKQTEGWSGQSPLSTSEI